MDQILWKKCPQWKTIKEKIDAGKNARKVWAGKEKALRHEKYKAWLTDYGLK